MFFILLLSWYIMVHQYVTIVVYCKMRLFWYYCIIIMFLFHDEFLPPKKKRSWQSYSGCKKYRTSWKRWFLRLLVFNHPFGDAGFLTSTKKKTKDQVSEAPTLVIHSLPRKGCHGLRFDREHLLQQVRGGCCARRRILLVLLSELECVMETRRNLFRSSDSWGVRKKYQKKLNVSVFYWGWRKEI